MAELFIIETSAETITDLMGKDVSWYAMIHNLLFSAVAVTKFTDNYSTGRYLMLSNPKHIKDVINK